MKRAIISDIHGNLEALQAVLDDFSKRDVDEIYCLGDVIGYGPNPCECLDVAMDFKVCILGNHDHGALFDPEAFSSGAERAIFWTRQQLEAETGEQQRIRRWDFLCELQRNHREGDLLFVHGSARSPLNEYIFPEDVYNSQKMTRVFQLIQQYCFQGHTHVPGVFTDSNEFFSPPDINNRYRLSSDKVMVNVGSVGQPRDGDPRSCYVTLEEQQVEFHRVEYPQQETANKIFGIPDLDDSLGERLLAGR